MKFRDRMIRFFYGRNGNDALNRLVFWVYFALLIVNLFLHSTAIWLIELVLVTLYLFRCFSRNLYRRQAENRKFLSIIRKFTAFFKLQKNKFRDRKTHVFRKCPHCRAVLRLPKKKGRHSVNCPQCRRSFGVKI